MSAEPPLSVIPPAVARAVADLPGWFVIGGQAVRCFAPYRPSLDVDFGVDGPEALAEMVDQLGRRGRLEILERSDDTVHLRFDGINVSIFSLPVIAPHAEERRLTATGILATKLHAILDRGRRRDFFDLYVVMQHHSLGVADALAAMRVVYGPELSEPLLLRALTYFDDAEQEAPLPGEGPKDWAAVKEFFRIRVGHLLVPPGRKLEIQSRAVDVHRD